MRDPYGVVATLLVALPGRGNRIAVSDTLWASHLLRFQATLRGTRFEPASPVLRELRMVKDADEIALLRLAAEAADRVVAQIAAGTLVGRTEADVAREVRERLIAEGHDTAQFAIVGSGPNSASPHHEASERVIQAGEPIVLDIGGTLGGYGSDVTRTLWVTGGDPAKGPDERFRHLFGVLQSAQAASTRAVRPGVACEAVDAAARGPIDAEGYGEAFFHRTGHGIGLEGHEDPYMIAGNDAAPPGGDGVLAWSPGSTWSASTARASRTSSSAARTGRSRSTRCPGSWPSSTGDGGKVPFVGYHRATGRVRASRHQPRTDDHQAHTPLRRRCPAPGRATRTDRPVSRRHGRGHHHERPRHEGPEPGSTTDARAVAAPPRPTPRRMPQRHRSRR